MVGLFYDVIWKTKYGRNYRYGKVWKEVFERDEICVLCKSDKELTIDHIISAKMGGKSILSNLRVLCRSCNSKNNQRTLKNDPKNIRNREKLKTFRERNPDYFKNKYKEFIARNPGYMTKYGEEYLKHYLEAKI